MWNGLSKFDAKDVLEKRYQEENTKLKEEVSNLERLQQKRINWTMILQDMNNRLPDHMWITGFTYQMMKKSSSPD
jgi:Tfp pilus assembly protein PilN